MDRETGENLVSTDFVGTNWTLGVGGDGRPLPNPAKQPQLDGALVSPDQYGAVNWPAAEFQPRTPDCFTAYASRAYSVYYLYDDDEKPEGWARKRPGRLQHSDAPGHRLPHRRDSMESPLGRPGPRSFGPALDGGQPALRRRHRQQPCGPRPSGRDAAMARGTPHADDQRSDHLRTGRYPVSCCRWRATRCIPLSCWRTELSVRPFQRTREMVECGSGRT